MYISFSLLNPIILNNKNGKNKIIKIQICKKILIEKIREIKYTKNPHIIFKNIVAYSINPNNLLLKL